MHFTLPVWRPAVMGILNVTPDSFSDGGRFIDTASATAAATAMVNDGADLIDVGGESSRPGAQPVSELEEIRRVIPVVETLVAQGIVVSVDTTKAEVARQCLLAGAQVVNDISALSDPQMASTCADAGCTVCLMHMKGNPQTMQTDPAYVCVSEEVGSFLLARIEVAEDAGVQRENIWIDPGIGFGKTIEHNLTLIRELGQLTGLGYPVLIGVSRKSMIGRVLADAVGALDVLDRLEGALALQVAAQLLGAKVIRTHDVKSSRRAVDMIAALQPS